MVAQVTGLEPGECVHMHGDVHLNLNCLDQADTRLACEPYRLPRMELEPGAGSIFDFTYDDSTVVGYEHHSVTRAPIAVWSRCLTSSTKLKS